MLKQITELCRCIAVMNSEGLDKLINCAKDISSNKNFRKPDCKLTPAQVEKAATLGLISSNALAPKEGIAEIRSTPQMSEEKKQLVSVLLNYIDFMLYRAQTVELEKFESELIHKLSNVVAVLVK